jgi:hypothetical protein
MLPNTYSNGQEIMATALSFEVVGIVLVIARITIAVALVYRPRDGSGQTRLGSGWAGLLGRLGHEKCRALARRSGLAR